MNKNLERALIFAAGAISGGCCAVLFTKKYFGDKARSEVEEVRSIYMNEITSKTSEETDDPQSQQPSQNEVGPGAVKEEPKEEKYSPEDRVEYFKILQSNGYVLEEKGSTKDIDGSITDECTHVVSEEEFISNHDEYESIELTLYADDILVQSEDGDETVVEREDAIGGIGTEAFDHLKSLFGVKSSDPDTVYIRNEDSMTQYEIVRDERTYEEVLNT
jgi:hypothetical protein